MSVVTGDGADAAVPTDPPQRVFVVVTKLGRMALTQFAARVQPVQDALLALSTQVEGSTTRLLTALRALPQAGTALRLDDAQVRTLTPPVPPTTVELGAATTAALKPLTPPTTLRLDDAQVRTLTPPVPPVPPTTVELGAATTAALKPLAAPTTVSLTQATVDRLPRPLDTVSLSDATLTEMRRMMSAAFKKTITTSVTAWTTLYFTSDGTAAGTPLFPTGFDAVASIPASSTLGQFVELDGKTLTSIRVRAWRARGTVLASASSLEQVAVTVEVRAETAAIAL